MTPSPPKTGTRIFLSGHFGTIKFIGSVRGTTGIWLGIEWDDPQRGRHDGAKDGVQYFTCVWVTLGLVAHLSHLFLILAEFLDRDHSFGRHPLSITGHPSHEPFFQNT